MKKRSYTCMFTGHRKLPAGSCLEISQAVESCIRDLYLRGITDFYTGGAIGFDSLAAETILRLQAEYPALQLHLALPCYNQEKFWSLEEQMRYKSVLSHAASTVYVSKEYTADCMKKRNLYMVEHSGICVCYLTQNTGGTFQTVRFAREQGLEIINLACYEQFSLF